MKQQKIFSYLFVFLSFMSCNCNEKKENTTVSYTKPINKSEFIHKPDYIIFGNYVGELHEPWTISFKYDNKGIYIDTLDAYQRKKYISFEKYPLPNFNLDIVSKVFNNIPSTLLDKKNKRIDCTECYDLGGTYLEIKIDNDTIIYHINCRSEKCTDSLKLFLNKIDILVNELISKNKIKWH
jgi:hypothetical protein